MPDLRAAMRRVSCAGFVVCGMCRLHGMQTTCSHSPAQFMQHSWCDLQHFSETGVLTEDGHAGCDDLYCLQAANRRDTQIEAGGQPSSNHSPLLGSSGRTRAGSTHQTVFAAWTRLTSPNYNSPSSLLAAVETSIHASGKLMSAFTDCLTCWCTAAPANSVMPATTAAAMHPTTCSQPAAHSKRCFLVCAGC